MTEKTETEGDQVRPDAQCSACLLLTFAHEPAILRNLTPHEVRLELTDGTFIALPPEPGPKPRVTLKRRSVGEIKTVLGTVHIINTVLQQAVTDLPSSECGTLLVVSRLVAVNCTDRSDLVFPDDVIRDDSGAIVAARSLGCL